MEQIDETPYHTSGKFSTDTLSKLSYSKNTLNTQFTKLGDYNDYEFYLQNTHWRAVVLHEGRFVAELMFKDRPTEKVDLPKILQVNSVKMDKKYRSVGAITELYISLVKHGYVILSDATQFTDGKMLWKRIARESDASGLRVRIYSKEKLGDKQYDGSNIPDSEIWSTGEDYSHFHTLLVLSKKD